QVAVTAARARVAALALDVAAGRDRHRHVIAVGIVEVAGRRERPLRRCRRRGQHIDREVDVLTATSATPKRTFTPTSDFYNPDCDHMPMPIPAGGNVESESGYACTGGGDCHL